MGRPTKLTAAVMTKVCQALLLGATYELAAKYAGVGYSTLKLWRSQAQTAKPGTLGYELLERMEAAEGQAGLRWLGQIEQAAQQGNWQAAAWKLERRWPDQYGRQILQHDGQVQLTTQPEWVALRQTVLDVLAPFPEVRAQLAEVLTHERNGTGA